MSARFTRCARLSRKVEFQRVFDQPIRSGDRYFTVLARPNELGHSRLGLAISRKAAKSAVARNRIKRIVRESFRHHQTGLDGLDVVVMGRPQMNGHDNAALFTSLQHHWARLVAWAKS